MIQRVGSTDYFDHWTSLVIETILCVLYLVASRSWSQMAFMPLMEG